MAIGDAIDQFILDCHFSSHNLTTVTLTCVICIPQVSYVHYVPTVYVASLLLHITLCVYYIIQVMWISVLKHLVP